MKIKICSKCKQEKATEEFYKNKAQKDGLSNWCITCVKIKDSNNKEARKEYNKNYRAINYDSISEKRKIYADKNKDHISEYQYNYREKNKDALLLQKKEYYYRNKEKIINDVRNYRNNHKEKIAIYRQKYYINNYETLKLQKQKYSRTEKGKLIDRNKRMRRRAATKKGDVTYLELKTLLQSKSCYWCGISLKNKKVHIDHYNPLIKGGEHTISNLVSSCQRCNSKKHAKDPISFANSIGKLL